MPFSLSSFPRFSSLASFARVFFALLRFPCALLLLFFLLPTHCVCLPCLFSVFLFLFFSGQVKWQLGKKGKGWGGKRRCSYCAVVLSWSWLFPSISLPSSRSPVMFFFSCWVCPPPPLYSLAFLLLFTPYVCVLVGQLWERKRRLVCVCVCVYTRLFMWCGGILIHTTQLIHHEKASKPIHLGLTKGGEKKMLSKWILYGKKKKSGK